MSTKPKEKAEADRKKDQDKLVWTRTKTDWDRILNHKMKGNI